ncbi:MAG: sulfurtransferase TusA family protein [Promethearchaeota archaeon]
MNQIKRTDLEDSNSNIKKSERVDRVDRILDLRGYQCPMTFVYTKVALEELESNSVLKIILDFRSAFTNVPKSIIKQNLGKILKEFEEKNEKTIWIKKI